MPRRCGPPWRPSDLAIAAGECVAVVGPSGSGKSTLCRALLDLLPPDAHCAGSVAWQGADLRRGSDQWRRLRGTGLGLVLQDHRHALDPVRRVGDQLAELVALHHPDLTAEGRRREVASLLARVALADGPDYGRRYPHELSGGQRQRVNLAAALAGRPALLLADEPTTALDLPVQREILGLLVRLVKDDGLALLLVTHDRGLVPLVADRVVTVGEAAAGPPPVATDPAAVRGAGGRAAGRARTCTVAVPSRGGRRDVVRGVTLELTAGRTVGLAGESGSGKTTLARTLAGWLEPRSGSVDLAGPVPTDPRARRRLIQLVSQDAAAALDPQQGVFAAVVEAARQVAAPAPALAIARPSAGRVRSHGGRWRAATWRTVGWAAAAAQLARALAVAPWFLLADEPASSLDPDRRRVLLQLLDRARREHGVGVLLVSHDLALLEQWCETVVVMLGGLVVECYRPARQGDPRHPVSRALAAADPARLGRGDLLREPSAMIAANQDPPGSIDAPGCPFAPRCPQAEAACRADLPPLIELADGHLLRCPVCSPRSR